MRWVGISTLPIKLLVQFSYVPTISNNRYGSLVGTRVFSSNGISIQIYHNITQRYEQLAIRTIAMTIEKYLKYFVFGYKTMRSSSVSTANYYIYSRKERKQHTYKKCN